MLSVTDTKWHLKRTILTALELIRDHWYPAWDSGDADRFLTVTRTVFSPDVVFTPRGTHAPPVRLEQAIPGWLRELAAWRPQVHAITHVIESRPGSAAWRYRWQVTHAGPLAVGDAVIAATGRSFESISICMCWADRGRITEFTGASDYHTIIDELRSAAAPRA